MPHCPTLTLIHEGESVADVDVLFWAVDPAKLPREFEAEGEALLSGSAGEPVIVASLGRASAGLVVLVPVPEGLDTLQATLSVALRGIRSRLSGLGEGIRVAVQAPIDSPEMLENAGVNLLLAAYSYTRKTRGEPSEFQVQSIDFLGCSHVPGAAAAVERAAIAARWIMTACDWVNGPPTEINPNGLAELVTNSVAGVAGDELTAEVWDETQLREYGCEGLLAVGAGSDADSNMVKITYRPSGARSRVALVGKGVTFDSGGLDIKGTSDMVDMKADMAGAATVAAATLAAAELKIPVAIDCYLALAENMLGGSAYKPGDVLVMRNGLTVEIRNTDAEGRLVMADALALAAESEPDAIVDAATLTGAVCIALGYRTAGIMGSHTGLVQALIRAGARCDEPLWELPITAEVDRRVKSSKIADVLQTDNTGDAGASFAASFLANFVDGTPWAHLDIAGSSFNPGAAEGSRPSGATGSGIRTLLDYLSETATGSALKK